MLKNVTSIFLPSLLIVLIANVAVGQQGANPASTASTRSSQQTAKDATTVFRSARDTITDGEWGQAVVKFDEYVRSYPNEKNIDAALYWLAYAQHKLGKYDQARFTVERLLQKYPNSNWRDDARLLLVQAPGSAALVDALVAPVVRAQTTVAPAIQQPLVYTPTYALPPIAIAPGVEPTVIYRGPDDLALGPAADDDPCEFKIVVLQALFQTDLQRAIVAATDWLKPGSNQTVRCKSAAVTLLGRNGGKSATPVILGVAKNETDLRLRARAVASLGPMNDDSVIEPLRDFALNAQENEIVEAAVYALSQQAGERALTALSDIALRGKSVPQRKMAISLISTRPGEPAVDALFRIYDADQSIDIRKAVISAFANRRSERAATRLFEIARGSDVIELRKAAISSLSRRSGDKTTEFLLNLYDLEKNEEVKDQIVNALGSGSSNFFSNPELVAPPGQTTIGYSSSTSRMNDERVITKMIEIARDQRAPMERRKRAIGWLSRSKHPKVLDFLQELLKQD